MCICCTSPSNGKSGEGVLPSECACCDAYDSMLCLLLADRQLGLPGHRH
jgi:hypothetical protein